MKYVCCFILGIAFWHAVEMLEGNTPYQHRDYAWQCSNFVGPNGQRWQACMQPLEPDPK